MKKNRFFNIHRFLTLLRREAHINLKRDLLIIGAIYSLFTLIMFLTFEFGNEEFRDEVLESFHLVIFGVMLFIGGAFITSFSFIELRDKMKSHFYVLTPGSNFEKFLVNILISFVVYIPFIILSYVVYSEIFNWLVSNIYEINFSGLDLFNENFAIIIQVFFLVQSVYFLGALSFKKYPIILTPIAGFLIIIMFSLANELFGNILLPEVELNHHYFERSVEDFITQYEILVKIALFYILPLIFWFTAYLKLNEKEY